MSKITSNPSRLLRKCVRPKKAGGICSIPMMGFTNSQTKNVWVSTRNVKTDLEK